MGCICVSWTSKILGIIRVDSGLAYVGIANLLSSLAGGLFWFIVASIIVAENYGELNYYISIASVLSIISLLGLNTTVITHLAKGSKKIGDQANVVLLFSSLITVLILIIVTNYYTALLFLGISFFSMTIAGVLGRQLYKEYFLLTISERAAQIGLAILLFFAIGLEGMIIGYAIGALAFSYKFFKSLRNFSFDISELRQRFSFLVHNYIFNISQTLTMHADKLIIAPLFGFTILGFYQLGFQFLMFLGIVPASLFQYLLPQFSSGNKSKRIVYIALLLAIFFALISLILVPFVINTFFKQYIDAISAAQIMGIGVVPMTINSILNAKLLAKEESKKVVIGAIIYSSMLVVLFYSLGITMGLTGLGIAVVVSLASQSTALVILSRQITLTGQIGTINKSN